MSKPDQKGAIKKETFLLAEVGALEVWGQGLGKVRIRLAVQY